MKSILKIVIAVAVSMVFIATTGVETTAFAAGAKGTKLPADGGEPGKDYMTYVKAVHKKRRRNDQEDG